MFPKNRAAFFLIWPFILGLISLGMAVFLHQLISQKEASGGSLPLPALVAFAYYLGGKWGIVAFFVLLALFAFYFGIMGFKHRD